MIIRNDALSKIGGLYYYENKLFHGIGLTTLDGIVTKRIKYEHGKPVGNYVSSYFPFDKEDLHIEAEYFTPGIEEPFEYQGKRLACITYYFKNNQCLLEQQYDENGWRASEALYDTLGELKHLYVYEEDFTQSYDFFDDKTIKKFEVDDKKKCSICLVFTDNGNVRCLRIGENYFNRINSLGDRVNFHLFEDVQFITTLRGAESLYITGHGVTEQVFELLLDNSVLRNTTLLNISRTKLRVKSIEKLISIKNIKTLEIESTILSFDDLKSFKSKRPDCIVKFNREEVL